MTPEQKAAQLQRVEEAEAVLAAYKAELVVGLAADRPASGDRQRGQVGAASGEWAAQLLDEDVSEFFPDELALVLNCSRAAATQLWERSTTLRAAAAGDLGGAGRRVAGLAAGPGDRRRAGLAGPRVPGRRAGRGGGGGAAAGHRAVDHPAAGAGARGS